VAQGVGLEFKPQYCNKIKKDEEKKKRRRRKTRRGKKT
jgi:hypothetical protein